MSSANIEQSLYEALGALPVIDTHTHLVGGNLGARGLHDVLLYHMAVSDLYAAGCPSGARLTEFPGAPIREEAAQRIQEALPYLQKVVNTSTSWAVRMILSDLYDWHEPITPSNWRRLDDQIRERSQDRVWHRQILRNLNVKRLGAEWARRGNGEDDDILQYALEWAFFTRCQWGEYDTALYELERCWGKLPGAPAPIGTGKRRPPERQIRSLEDVHAAMAHYVGAFPEGRILSVATHIATDLDLSPVSDGRMAEALARRESAGEPERSMYASYINEIFLAALEAKGGKIMFQFSFGAEPLPYETGSRLSQRSIAQLGEMVSRHPGLRFQCYLASRHANQSLCTLCRELPNLSLAGYWWHNFCPSVIRQVIEERLDMLPVNKQVGFFSDAYCAEWVHGKMMIVRRSMADVLGAKVRSGQYSPEQAIDIARQILFETPQTLAGFEPSNAL